MMVTRVSVALKFCIRLFMEANISGFNSVVFSVIGDVPVDSDASVVISILKIC